MIQKTSYFDSLILSVLSEHLTTGGFSGPLYNLTLALLQAPLTLTPATTWEQLTECTFSGYSRVTGLTWGVPLLQPDGTYTILSQLATFYASAASDFVQNTVAGWALIDTAASPNLIMAEMFQQVYPIVNPGDGFGLVIQYNEGPLNPNSYGNVMG